MIRFVSSSKSTDDEHIKYIANKYNISPICAKLITLRGIEDIDAFLSEEGVFHDPMLLHDMDKAVCSIKEHIKKGSRIVVYGDYDADGVCASSIMYLFLQKLGANVHVYLPSRKTDGYGLNKGAIDEIAHENTSLLITVDCGISNCDEVEYAAEKGIDVIVTDHHQCPAILPKCVAVVNPLLGDYPFKLLCGSGVALKIVEAFGGDDFNEYTDIAAIATVADLVPLIDENRAIVKRGLKLINGNNIKEGIKAIINVSGIKEGEVSAGQIAFAIGPRLNAAGRMDTANTAFDLLTQEDYDKAYECAKILNSHNSNRKNIETNIINEAQNIIDENVDISGTKVIVVSSANWHKGVIGIVASKLVERYGRPVIVFSEENGECVGSARSIPGIHIFNLINSFGSMLIKYGGHEMAAGMSIKAENMDAFSKALNKYADENYSQELFIPTVHYDCELELIDVNLKLTKDLEKLSPMGMGNKTPVFKISDISFKTPRLIGNDKSHVKMSVVSGDMAVDAVGFSMGDRFNEFYDDYRYDAAVNVSSNCWNGVDHVELMIKDFKPNLKSSGSALIAKGARNYFDSVLAAASYKTCKVDLKRVRHMWNWEIYLSRRLKKDVLGSAIYTSIPTCSYELFSYLEKEGLCDNVDVYYGSPKGNSCIVMAPDWTVDKLKYNRLIIFDYAPTDFVDRVLKNNPNIQIVICNNDFTDNYINMFTMGLAFERERAKVYYSIITKLCENTVTRDELVKRFCKAYNETPFNAYYALGVFYELGFIKIDSEMVFLCDNPDKKDLNQSDIIKNISKLEKKIYEEIELIKPPRKSKGK